MDIKTKEFIRKAKEKHGDKYDYSKSVYITNKQKVVIICKEHGEFLQTPNDHLSGRGCSKCGGTLKLDIVSFIKKSASVHGDNYDYSKTVYVNSKQKVVIICKEHGEFLQTPNCHLTGKGCPLCGRIENGNSRRWSTEYFVLLSNKVHNNKYIYTNTVYHKSHLKVCIICPFHSEFYQTPNDHISGHGCPKCGGTSVLSTSEFVNKSIGIHVEKYTYEKVIYTTNRNKVCITCKKHGDFLQTPNDHLSGVGCPKCKNSIGESKIFSFLQTKSIPFSQEKRFKDCANKRPLPFDFFLPEYNICIEFDGLQHFEPFGRWGGSKSLNYVKQNDTIKNTFCVNNNIGLIRIRYDEKDRIEEILTECITHGIRYRGLPIETCQSFANI